MIKNLKTVLSAFAGVCLITTMFSACSQTGTSRAPGQNNGRQLAITQTQGLNRNNLMNATTQYSQNNMTGTTLYNRMGANLGVNQGINPGINQGTNLAQTAPNLQKANNIKRQLMNMTGVQDANVIVMGNTALVGLKTRTTTKDITALRTSIANKVKAIDNTITNVTVSDSTDIMDRMNRLGTDITNNRPVNTITDEFNNLVRGVAPGTR